MMGPDRFMWGSDYPHDEGTPPYSKEHLRQVFHRVGEPEVGVTDHAENVPHPEGNQGLDKHVGHRPGGGLSVRQRDVLLRRHFVQHCPDLRIGP